MTTRMNGYLRSCICNHMRKFIMVMRENKLALFEKLVAKKDVRWDIVIHQMSSKDELIGNLALDLEFI